MVSTRCSIYYITCGEVVVHIYRQIINDKIYLEVEGGDNHVALLVPLMDENNPARSPSCPEGEWKIH